MLQSQWMLRAGKRWLGLMMGLLLAGAAQALEVEPKVAAGSYFSLALGADGTLYGWGSNWWGQVGNGEGTGNITTPQKIGEGFIDIDAGHDHSLALKADGSLWAWGSNQYGQLGDETEPLLYGRVNAPKKIGTGFVAISAGSYHNLAVKKDGTLWAWGWNGYGQLGDGTKTSSSVPKQIGSGYSAVAAGTLISFALKSDGSLDGWGDRSCGALGEPVSHDPTLTPTNQASDIAKIFGGILNTIVVIKQDGSMWRRGKAVDLDSEQRLKTASVMTLVGSGYRSAAVGDHHVLALKTDGSLWAWGVNGAGVLGSGASDWNLQTATPVQVTGSAYASVAAGGTHSLAVKEDGSVWGWGENRNGQVGDGTTKTFSSPQSIGLNLRQPYAAPLGDADRIFNYLEAAYAEYLKPAAAKSATADAYYYRHYSESQAYVATSACAAPQSGDCVYYLGPASGNAVLLLGTQDEFLQRAIAAGK